MTVSSSTNRVSYSGNGTLTVFAYTFKVFDESDLTVILRASDGTETVQTITTHYTVSGVGDAGGGNVTFVTAPTATETVVILREQPLTQGLDLVPNDPFPAQSLEESLDKLTFVDQRLNEKIDRALTFSVGDVVTDATLPVKELRVGKVLAFNETTGDPEPGPSIADTESIANISADIATLADIEDGTLAINAITNVNTIRTDVTTVSGISANVTTVAGNNTNVTTVATDLSGSDTIGTVAGSITNVNTVATDITNVNTTATDIANINTVAGISSNVTVVATNLTDVNSFANTYKISASEPSSPTEGMLWYDSTNDIVKVYNGSSFQNSGATVNGVSARDSYTATGGQTNFSSSYDPTFLDVYLNGVKLLNGTDFTATDGSTVVLTSGASAGDLIEIVAFGSFNLTDTYSTRDALGLGSSDNVTFSSVSATLTGNVTGDLTGDVTGNLTGDVTGDVTGNVTGNVTMGTTEHGTVSSAFSLNAATNGQIQSLTLGASITITSALNAGDSVILMVNDGSAYSITWSGFTWSNNDGVAPTLITTGFNVFTVWKIGTVTYIAYAGDQ